MTAPPGYPKITETPSWARTSQMICAPVRFTGSSFGAAEAAGVAVAGAGFMPRLAVCARARGRSSTRGELFQPLVVRDARLVGLVPRARQELLPDREQLGGAAVQ